MAFYDKDGNEISEYEAQRLERIAKNEARLESLGFHAIKNSLTTKTTTVKKKPKAHGWSPQRKSKRLHKRGRGTTEKGPPKKHNTKSTGLGSISARNGNKFQVSVNDPPSGKYIYVGLFDSHKNARIAQRAAHESLVSFHESTRQHEEMTLQEQKEAVAIAKQAAQDAVAKTNPNQPKTVQQNKKHPDSDPVDSDTDSSQEDHDMAIDQDHSTQVAALEGQKLVGSRAYCRWSDNNAWYWGTITRKTKVQKGHQEEYWYSVQFDDGDSVEKLGPQHVWTVQSYRRLFEDEPPSPPDKFRHLSLAHQLSFVDKQGYTTDNDTSSNETLTNPADEELSLGSNNNELTSSETSTNATVEEQPPKSQNQPATEVSSLSPAELYKRRCKNCLLCRKEDCGKCATCCRATSGMPEVCLRKMCCEIPIMQKAQPALGFPAGWHFVFDDPRANRRFNDPGLEGLTLLAPNGRNYRSLKRAINHNSTRLGKHESLHEDFCSHVGATVLAPQWGKELVGKRIRQDWTNVHGRNKFVYGVVTGFNVLGGNTPLTVVYGGSARRIANSTLDSGGSGVPRSRKISLELALGAIASYYGMRTFSPSIELDRSISSHSQCWTWHTPEWRKKEMLNDGCGLSLPRLCLVLRGFRLLFSVKKSTIPGAGYGVFVQCEDMVAGIDGQERDFVLQEGEFVDLGIYAPFRKQDKKKKRVFFVKNYIHSFKCEEWCFNTEDDDYDFDIADDYTGDAHALSRGNIPAYVNECKTNEIASIRAEHDPEGSVHYLLGVVEGEKLTLPCHGAETELFINYGSNYDLVRIRKGYTELPDTLKQQKLKELEEGDKEYLREISSFTLEEVCDCVCFFQNMLKKQESKFSTGEALEAQVGNRALVVCRLLEQRAKALEESGEVVPVALIRSASDLASTLQRFFGTDRDCNGSKHAGPDRIVSSTLGCG